MRVVFVTMCYMPPWFSGNCFAARSYVGALRTAGHEVRVLCARFASGEMANGPDALDEDDAWTVAVGSWFRVDFGGPWAAFADGFAADEAAIARVVAFLPDVVCLVDFSAAGPVATLAAAFAASGLAVPVVFMPFRVYSSEPSSNPADHAAMAAIERACCERAVRIVALGSLDAARLVELFGLPGHDSIARLNPPLRASLAAAATARPLLPATDAGRRVLLCCVRIVPAKNVDVFVRMVELVGAARLAELDVEPVLCGAAPDQVYAEQIYARLLAACPFARVIRQAVDARALAELFARCRLNVHPALYEPWGLTLHEAAAFGAPSLCHAENVGVACDLLKASAGAIALTDMADAERAAADLVALLGAPERLQAVAESARAAALAWGEPESGLLLERYLDEAVRAGS